MIKYIATIVFAVFLSSCDFDTSFKIELGNKESSHEPIPGPRDCFWSRGPVSKDPYINIAYPFFIHSNNLKRAFERQNLSQH